MPVANYLLHHENIWGDYKFTRSWYWSWVKECFTLRLHCLRRKCLEPMWTPEYIANTMEKRKISATVGNTASAALSSRPEWSHYTDWATVNEVTASGANPVPRGRLLWGERKGWLGSYFCSWRCAGLRVSCRSWSVRVEKYWTVSRLAKPDVRDFDLSWWSVLNSFS